MLARISLLVAATLDPAHGFAVTGLRPTATGRCSTLTCGLFDAFSKVRECDELRNCKKHCAQEGAF